jgi:hypothetical protein
MASDALYAIARVTAREHALIGAARAGGGRMKESPDKVASLVEVCRALRGISAPHALVGGVAVGVRSGVPRATMDTDLAVRSTVDRAAAVQALTSAGLRLTGEFAHSVNFRHQSGEPVQLVFDPQFDPMIDRAETIDVEGTAIPVVRKADLITMKERAAADPARRKSKALRDLADVAILRGDVPDPDEGW